MKAVLENLSIFIVQFSKPFLIERGGPFEGSAIFRLDFLYGAKDPVHDDLVKTKIKPDVGVSGFFSLNVPLVSMF
jgi:hypothetical protein